MIPGDSGGPAWEEGGAWRVAWRARWAWPDIQGTVFPALPPGMVTPHPNCEGLPPPSCAAAASLTPHTCTSTRQRAHQSKQGSALGAYGQLRAPSLNLTQHA